MQQPHAGKKKPTELHVKSRNFRLSERDSAALEARAIELQTTHTDVIRRLIRECLPLLKG